MTTRERQAAFSLLSSLQLPFSERARESREGRENKDRRGERKRHAVRLRESDGAVSLLSLSPVRLPSRAFFPHDPHSLSLGGGREKQTGGEREEDDDDFFCFLDLRVSREPLVEGKTCGCFKSQGRESEKKKSWMNRQEVRKSGDDRDEVTSCWQNSHSLPTRQVTSSPLP